MSDRGKSARTIANAQHAGEQDAKQVTLHATCVALGDRGVLITGPSGSGKSDLALRLIDGGARLIVDDLTTLTIADGALIALAPPDLGGALAGHIEVRGIGIVAVATAAQARLALEVALTPSAEIERLPEPETARYLGVALRKVRIDPVTASAAAKVRLAATSNALERPPAPPSDAR
ncbi:MAG: HPr kinase/phosphatase C-terminal domain-containing protein [Alphaproteobacteria bacterium]|nr:HPr kinase/phosphatase C-terminal domain-containing protein [Alphaproteobacteria bacterium]